MKTKFTVVGVYMALWVLKVASSVSADQDVNNTVDVHNGAKSVVLSCGKVPKDAAAIEWYSYKTNEWKNILKFYHNIAGTSPEYYLGYTDEKYDISGSMHTSLLIKHIKMSEFGLFKCSTTGGSMSYSYTTLLKVWAEAATINMTKVPQLSVKEGSVVAFMCETGFAYPNPPAVRWFVDDVPIDRKGGYTEENNQLFGNYNIQMTKSTLNFLTKREMNDKEVKCVLVNDDTKLIKHSLNVMYPPEVIVEGTSTPAVEYTIRNLTCTTSGGNPSDPRNYSYKWTYKPTYADPAIGILVPSGKAVTYSNKILQIENLGYKEMAGTYNCTVSGIGGQSTGSGTLEVYYPPEVSVEGTTTPVLEYTARNITCNTTGGNPSDPRNYNYEWTYKPTYGDPNIFIQVPLFSNVISSKSQIQLTNLGYKEMAGTYKCTVTSIGGQNSESSILDVYYPAKSNNPHDLTVYSALKSAVVLTVKFHMNPVNNYTAFWSINGLELDHANVRDIVKGQQVQTTYFIPDLTEEQLGNYTVQVINWDIASKQNEATFNVILKWSDNRSLPLSMSPTVMVMGVSLGLLVITLIIGGSAWYKTRKSKKDKPKVKKDSSQEYIGLNTDGTQEPINAAVVYDDLQTNTQETTGDGGYEIIPETTFTVAATIESDYLQPITRASKSTAFSDHMEK